MHLNVPKSAVLLMALSLALLAGTVAAALWSGVTGTAGQPSNGTRVGVAEPLDAVLGTVAPFELIDQRGRKITRDDLLGDAWVAGFIFTRCAGPCLRIVGQMKLLDARLPPEVRLVCFSVDPDYDTPEVLSRYRDLLKIQSDRWLFLTGPRDPLYRLIRESFHLGVEPAAPGTARPGDEVTHSTRLAVVDRNGNIRGYFDGENLDEIEQLAGRVRELSTAPHD
jgi:cytochrome oxidase Cu insertion factor (SCO1/SenC/PrrC family)